MNKEVITEEDYDMVCRENKAMAEYLKDVGLTDDEISDICNGKYINENEIKVVAYGLYKFAKMKETYEIYMKSNKEKLCEDFDVTSLDEISDIDLAEAIYQKFGDITNQEIIDLDSCKEENIAYIKKQLG